MSLKAKEKREEKNEAKQAEKEQLTGTKRVFRDSDVRAANRVALGEIPYVFQPHKQSKGIGDSTGMTP